jgi:hypothetical protein
MKIYIVCAALLIAAWSLSGCTSAVRYSPDEIKNYPPEIQQSIREGRVMMGMTTRQVRYTLGAPATVNVISPTLDGKPREEWIYSTGVGVFVKTRLLFVDGRLADVYPEQEQPAQKQPEQQNEKTQDEQGQNK